MIGSSLTATLATTGEWQMAFQLSPWRDEGSAPTEGTLVVTQTSPDHSALEVFRAHWPAVGSSVEVEVDRVRPTERDVAVAPLRSWRAIEDEALRAFAAAHVPAPEIHDPHLGRLAYDRSLEIYAGECPVGAVTCAIQLWPHRPRRPDEVIVLARAHVTWLGEHLPAVHRAVTDELWPLWVEAWREDDEPVDRAAFDASITLAVISVEEDAAAELRLGFDEAGLFGGHSVDVVVRSGEVVDVALSG